MSTTLLMDAVFAFLVLYLCRRLRKFPRLVAIMCAFGAFFAAMAFPVLIGSIADRGATNVGLTVLLMIDVAGAVVFVGEVVFGNKHHPVMTPLVCTVFGLSLAATVVDLPLLKTHSTQMLPATAAALRQQIAHARTVHATSASAVSAQYSHLLLLGLGVLVFVLVLRWNHNRTHQPQPKRLTSGGGGGILSRFTGGKKGSSRNMPRRPVSAGQLPRGFGD